MLTTSSTARPSRTTRTLASRLAGTRPTSGGRSEEALDAAALEVRDDVPDPELGAGRGAAGQDPRDERAVGDAHVERLGQLPSSPPG